MVHSRKLGEKPTKRQGHPRNENDMKVAMRERNVRDSMQCVFVGDMC